MIYISTGGFHNKNAFQASKDLMDAGCTFIELSAGKYSESLLSDLRSLANSANFQIHNYFPPPKNPFVFNLASNCSLDEKEVNFFSTANFGCKLKIIIIFSLELFS